MWRACLARAVQRIVLRFRRNDACAESDWVEMSIRLPASAFQRTSVILPQSPPSYKPNLLGTGLKMIAPFHRRLPPPRQQHTAFAGGGQSGQGGGHGAWRRRPAASGRMGEKAGAIGSGRIRRGRVRGDSAGAIQAWALHMAARKRGPPGECASGRDALLRGRKGWREGGGRLGLRERDGRSGAPRCRRADGMRRRAREG